MSNPFTVRPSRGPTVLRDDEPHSGNEVHISVPAIPVGVNHYVKHTRNGRHYVTAEAKAFKQMVALAYRQSGQRCVAEQFGVGIKIFLGVKQRLDVDGGAKLLIDALAEIGAFTGTDGHPRSDAHVTGLVVEKERSEDGKGRTEIKIMER